MLLAVVLAMLTEPKIGFKPDPDHKMADPILLFIGYVLMVGLLQPLLPALLLLMVTTGQGGGWQRLTHVLSAPAFMSFSSLTYDIYLLHALVRCSLITEDVHSVLCVTRPARPEPAMSHSAWRPGLQGSVVHLWFHKSRPPVCDPMHAGDLLHLVYPAAVTLVQPVQPAVLPGRDRWGASADYRRCKASQQALGLGYQWPRQQKP